MIRMKILLSNDDGVDASGILAAKKVAEEKAVEQVKDLLDDIGYTSIDGWEDYGAKMTWTAPVINDTWALMCCLGGCCTWICFIF